MEIRFYHHIFLLGFLLIFPLKTSSASYGHHFRIPGEFPEDYSLTTGDISPWKSSKLQPASGLDYPDLEEDDENSIMKSPLKRVPKNDQKPSYHNYRTFQLLGLGQWHSVKDKLGRREQTQKSNSEARKPQVADVAPPKIIETSVLEDEMGPIVPAKLISMPDLDPELIPSSDDNKRNAQKPQERSLQKDDAKMLDHNIVGFTSSHWGPLGKRDNIEATTLPSVGDKRTKNDVSYNRQRAQLARLLSFYLKHPTLARQVVAQQIARPR